MLANWKRFVAAGALVALGLLTAVIVARPASAWYPGDLPRLGYSVSVINLLEPGCKEWHATGYGASANLGSDCDPGFQARLDDFINTTCPCVQTTTETVASPVGTTTTEVTVTTPPPVETNAAAATTATTTVQADPLPPVTTTVTATVTAPVSVTDPTIAALQAQIDTLNARVDGINTRVIALETAAGIVVYGTPNGYAPAGVAYTAAVQ